MFTVSVADWDTVLDVNLRAAFLMSREAQRHTARWGRIVNQSSSATSRSAVRAGPRTSRPRG